MSERYEAGWLIERAASPVSRPEYFSVTQGGGHVWTEDHAKALRMARRDDAVMLALYIFDGLGDLRIAEHGWGP